MTTPTGNIYLDTSALMRMVECDVGNPSPRNLHAGELVARRCENESPPVGLSSLTLIEFHNALATDWRSSDAGYEEYDQPWVERSQVKVMELLARQRLILRSIPASADAHAIALVTLATRDSNINLGVWDAIHLITASAWAYELQTIVELWTTDQGFRRFVDLFPEFKQFVQIRNLDE